MKKVWLSILLCLCLLAGITGAAATATGTTIKFYEETTTVDETTGATSTTQTELPALQITVDENDAVIVLPTYENGKSEFVGWAYTYSDASTTVDTSANYNGGDTPSRTVVYEAGEHPITAFDFAAGNTQFVARFRGGSEDAESTSHKILTDIGGYADISIWGIATNSINVETPLVYKVQMEWGDMQFAFGTWTDGYKVWYAKEHKYYWTESNDTAEWYLVNKNTPLEGPGIDQIDERDRTQANIVMFNHSNAPVRATIELADAIPNDDVLMMVAGGFARADTRANGGTDAVVNGVNYTTVQAESAGGTGIYNCVLQAGVVNETHDATPEAESSAVVRVWPTQGTVDLGEDILDNEAGETFEKRTAVANLTVTLQAEALDDLRAAVQSTTGD